MPKVTHVKKARKAYPEAGIEKGDSYYWWAFMRGPTICSKTAPTRSQLTRSPHLGAGYDLEDRLGELSPDESCITEIESIISDLETARDEAQDNLDNMPEQLQETNVLNEYIEAFDEMISTLESIDVDTWSASDDDSNVNDDDLTEEEYYQNIVDEAAEVTFNC